MKTRNILRNLSVISQKQQCIFYVCKLNNVRTHLSLFSSLVWLHSRILFPVSNSIHCITSHHSTRLTHPVYIFLISSTVLLSYFSGGKVKSCSGTDIVGVLLLPVLLWKNEPRCVLEEISNKYILVVSITYQPCHFTSSEQFPQWINVGTAGKHIYFAYLWAHTHARHLNIVRILPTA